MLLDVTVARSVSIVGSGGVKVSGAACCELIHSFESFRVPGRSCSGGGGSCGAGELQSGLGGSLETTELARKHSSPRRSMHAKRVYLVPTGLILACSTMRVSLRHRFYNLDGRGTRFPW